MLLGGNGVMLVLTRFNQPSKLCHMENKEYDWCLRLATLLMVKHTSAILLVFTLSTSLRTQH